MDPEIIDYGADGTIDDLATTCGGDEDGFRAKLVRLQRGTNPQGEKGIRATYNPIPFDKPYFSKELFFFDITNASADEIHDLNLEQLAKGRALAFPGADRAQVYLGDEEAVVAVYREP